MSVDNQYPTVATIIGCPEELTDANGLVATPIGLTENVVKTDDPVRKAVLDNICGNLPAKATLDLRKCDVCNISCNGEISFEKHLNGAKHAKKLKERDMENLNDLPFIIVDSDKKLYKCTLCATTMNAKSQINGHIAGSRHKTKVQQQPKSDDSQSGDGDDGKNKSKVDLTPNLLYCATCNVHVNSKVQLDQHTASKKHINRVNGTVGKYTVRPSVARQTRQTESQPYFVRARGSTSTSALTSNSHNSSSTRAFSSSSSGGSFTAGGSMRRGDAYLPSSSQSSSPSLYAQRRIQNSSYSPLNEYFHRRPANNASSYF